MAFKAGKWMKFIAVCLSSRQNLQFSHVYITVVQRMAQKLEQPGKAGK